MCWLTPAIKWEFSWYDAELFDPVRQLKTVTCHIKKCESQIYSVGKATDYKIENRISISGWGGNFLSIPTALRVRIRLNPTQNPLSWRTQGPFLENARIVKLRSEDYKLLNMKCCEFYFNCLAGPRRGKLFLKMWN